MLEDTWVNSITTRYSCMVSLTALFSQPLCHDEDQHAEFQRQKGLDRLFVNTVLSALVHAMEPPQTLQKCHTTASSPLEEDV